MSEGVQSTNADPRLVRPLREGETEPCRTEPCPTEPRPTEPRGLGEFLLEYARENPASAALWCFGVGFVLGWRLKPW